MFNVTRTGVDRLDIEMSGKLNAQEIKIAIDELTNNSEDIDMCLYYAKYLCTCQ